MSISRAIREAQSLDDLVAAWKGAQAVLKTFPVRWQAELTGDKDRRKAELLEGVAA